MLTLIKKKILAFTTPLESICIRKFPLPLMIKSYATLVTSIADSLYLGKQKGRDTLDGGEGSKHRCSIAC